jgi:hypothetical protein
MNEGGTLAPIFGGILGTGPGSGMALMFIISGTLGILVGLGGYAVPIIRNVEDILPDHDAIPSPPPALANQLQKLIDDRQRIIEQPNSPARDLALRRISERMREIGRQPR